MIKNIVLDVGGVFFDNSKHNIEKLLNKNSFNYINELIDISKIFDGGIYSYQEHLIKPEHDIYNLLINKFNLNKEETMFFDDKQKILLQQIK